MIQVTVIIVGFNQVSFISDTHVWYGFSVIINMLEKHKLVHNHESAWVAKRMSATLPFIHSSTKLFSSYASPFVFLICLYSHLSFCETENLQYEITQFISSDRSSSKRLIGCPGAPRLSKSVAAVSISSRVMLHASAISRLVKSTNLGSLA